MSGLIRGLTVAAVVSAAGLLAILFRGARGLNGRMIRPLFAGVLCMNAIGLVLVIAARLPENSWLLSGNRPSSSGLPMAAETAIFLLKFGWLLGFLTFLRRFALPIGDRMFRRLVMAVAMPAVVLLAAGWTEFLLTSRRGLFQNLQALSDYFVFFATVGAGFYLRSRSEVLVGRDAKKAMITLGSFAASVFIALGLWWIVGSSVSQVAPTLRPAFLHAMFLAFNIGLAVWLVRFSDVLAGPESTRFYRRQIPGSLFARWGISRREAEIIELVGQGLSNQDIADRLFISLFTVKKHINTVFQKTGVENRVQLVRLFASSGTDSSAGSEAARPGAREG